MEFHSDTAILLFIRSNDMINHVPVYTFAILVVIVWLTLAGSMSQLGSPKWVDNNEIDMRTTGRTLLMRSVECRISNLSFLENNMAISTNTNCMQTYELYANVTSALTCNVVDTITKTVLNCRSKFMSKSEGWGSCLGYSLVKDGRLRLCPYGFPWNNRSPVSEILFNFLESPQFSSRSMGLHRLQRYSLWPCLAISWLLSSKTVFPASSSF